MDKCSRKNPVPFHVRYPLLILSAAGNRLPYDLEDKILEYVMRNSKGIYYVYESAINEFPSISERRFYGWLQAHLLLSGFTLWKEKAMKALNWIWDQRNSDNVWDYGSYTTRKPFSCFPLSESWREKKNRVIDCSIIVLELLNKALD